MTEALPVTDIDLAGIRAAGAGNGVCVGTPVAGARVAIAALGPRRLRGRPHREPVRELTGEILVRAPHVKDRYDRLWITEPQVPRIPGWHRTGDVGHLDDAGRLWVEGRLGHILRTPSGIATPVAAEHAAESVAGTGRAAIVGVGPAGTQVGVAVLETVPPARRAATAGPELASAVRTAVAGAGLELAAVLVVPALPTDIRHNSKIDRAALAALGRDHAGRRKDPDPVSHGTGIPSPPRACHRRQRAAGRQGRGVAARPGGTRCAPSSAGPRPVPPRRCSDRWPMLRRCAAPWRTWMPSSTWQPRCPSPAPGTNSLPQTSPAPAPCWRRPRAAGVRELVFVSSPSVAHFGAALAGAGAGTADPERARGHYARSKAAAELLALAADAPGFRVAAIRPHVVWGPGDTQLVERVVARARAGRLPLLDAGAALIDTTYIDNAAEAIVRGLERMDHARGQALVVTNGEPRPVGELIGGICRAAGVPPRRGASRAGWPAAPAR